MVNVRKTIKLNNNNSLNQLKTFRNNQEYKVAFPPTYIRDWTSPIKPNEPAPGWMGSNNQTRNATESSSDIHNLSADPLQPEPEPVQTTRAKVPWYAQATAASRARVKATNVEGRKKTMAEHYKKIGTKRRVSLQASSAGTRRNKKNRKHK